MSGRVAAAAAAPKAAAGLTAALVAMGAAGLEDMVSAAKNADAGELEVAQPMASPGDVRGATGGTSVGGEMVVIRDGAGKTRGTHIGGDTMALEEILPLDRATESSDALESGTGLLRDAV